MRFDFLAELQVQMNGCAFKVRPVAEPLLRALHVCVVDQVLARSWITIPGYRTAG